MKILYAHKHLVVSTNRARKTGNRLCIVTTNTKVTSLAVKVFRLEIRIFVKCRVCINEMIMSWKLLQYKLTRFYILINNICRRYFLNWNTLYQCSILDTRCIKNVYLPSLLRRMGKSHDWRMCYFHLLYSLRWCW